MMFSKSRLNSHDVFRNSVEKPHNTYTTQLVSSIAFQSSYFVGSSEQNNGKEFNDLLVWPSILCLIRYYFVSSKSCSFFGEIWAWHVCILTEKRQNANINHTGKKKWEVNNSCNSPDFSFAYILMHGKEEWVLI